MKTKVMMLMLVSIMNMRVYAEIHDAYLSNSHDAEFINVCAGIDDTLVIYKPDTAVSFIVWMTPQGDQIWYQDSIIVTFLTQGNWYFSSLETDKDIYVYFLSNPPYQPSCMAHDTIFPYGSIINWTLDAENLTAGYSCLYLWDDSTIGQYRTITGPGTYWLKITNACGERIDTLHVDIATTDIHVNDIQECVIYPNPTKEKLYVKIKDKRYLVKILSLEGKEMLVEYDASILDVEHLPKAWYILQIVSDEYVLQKKIMIE